MNTFKVTHLAIACMPCALVEAFRGGVVHSIHCTRDLPPLTGGMASVQGVELRLEKDPFSTGVFYDGCGERWPAEWLHGLRPIKEPTFYSIGDRFVRDGDRECILAQVEANRVALIYLQDGNRASNPQFVDNIRQITEQEFATLTMHPEKFTKIPKP